MSEFKGSIRLAGQDEKPIEASLAVDDDRLVVAVQDYEIGDWSLEELVVEQHEDTFHIRVEDEELMAKVGDAPGFAESLRLNDRRLNKLRAKKAKSRRRARSAPKAAQADKAPPVIEPVHKAPPVIESTVAPVPETPSSDAKPNLSSRWSTLTPRQKAAGLGAIGLIIFGVLAPVLLGMVLMLTGMVGLFGAIAVKSDTQSAVRLPAFFGSTPVIVTGMVMMVVGVILTAIG